MSKKIVIGITGTLGSGKDTAAEYVCRRYKTQDYSTSTEIGYELTKRGMDHSRPNKVVVANELREKFGTGELARRCLARATEEILVISAIRNVGEIEYLRENSNFFLISVDAPIELRYERITKRERLGDGKTFEDFKVSEDRERNAGPTGQQLFPCMALADFTVINDSDLETFSRRIDQAIDIVTAKNIQLSIESWACEHFWTIFFVLVILALAVLGA